MFNAKRSSFAVFCCIMMACAALTACGSDDDHKNNPNGNDIEITDLTAVGVKVNFNFESTADILQYCDITVSYDDGNGVKTETMTAPKWSKTVSAKLPSVVTFIRKVTTKAGVELKDVEKLDYTADYNYSYDVLNAAGEVLTSVSPTPVSNHQSLSGAQVAALIREGLADQTVSIFFDINGKNQ